MYWRGGRRSWASRRTSHRKSARVARGAPQPRDRSRARLVEQAPTPPQRRARDDRGGEARANVDCGYIDFLVHVPFLLQMPIIDDSHCSFSVAEFGSYCPLISSGFGRAAARDESSSKGTALSRLTPAGSAALPCSDLLTPTKNGRPLGRWMFEGLRAEGRSWSF